LNLLVITSRLRVSTNCAAKITNTISEGSWNERYGIHVKSAKARQIIDRDPIVYMKYVSNAENVKSCLNWNGYTKFKRQWVFRRNCRL